MNLEQIRKRNDELLKKLKEKRELEQLIKENKSLEYELSNQKIAKVKSFIKKKSNKLIDNIKDNIHDLKTGKKKFGFQQ